MLSILLAYDVPRWAFDYETRVLEKTLPRKIPEALSVTRLPSSQVTNLRKYDIVYSSAYYALKLADHPKSLTQISSYSYWVRKGWKPPQRCECGNPKCAGWPHLVLWKSVGAKNADIHQRLLPERPDARLLYHPADPEVYIPRPRSCGNELRVGFAGHRRGIKGFSLIRDAVAATPGTVLVTRTWEGGDRVDQAGMVDFYNSLDCYVCMSRPGQDAGPMTVVEAGLCGVPIVTTKAGQSGEMVKDGENGLVVGRSVESLSGALRRLSLSRDEAIKMGNRAAESFREEWVYPALDRWSAFFTEAL